MSRFENAKNGIAWGIINNIVVVVLPFVTRTIIIHRLGNEYVGLGGLFTSLLSVLSLAELGVGSAISYIFYEPVANGNFKRINSLLNMYHRIYRAIGVIILILSLVIMPFLKYLISGKFPDGINIYYLYLIYVANTVSSYLMFAYKKVLFNAYQRYDVQSILNSVTVIIQFLLQIIVLLIFNNYYIYSIIFPVATILDNIISNIYLVKKYPMCRCEGDVDKKDLSVIKESVAGAFLAKIGTTVYSSVDNIVISAFLGLTILGRYGNYYYVIVSLIGIFAVIHNSIRPIIGNCIVTETKEKNWKVFQIINYCYMFLVVVCSSCCMSLYQDFETWWQGESEIFSVELVVLFVIYFYIGRANSIVEVYREAVGIWTAGRLVPLFAAVMNLIFNIVFIRVIGLYGVLLSSILSTLFISIPGMTRILFLNYFEDMRKKRQYYLEMVKSFIKDGIIIGANYYFCSYISVSHGLLSLFVKAFISCLISIVLFVLINWHNQLFRKLRFNKFNIKTTLQQL